jgi:hypothetical protein
MDQTTQGWSDFFDSELRVSGALQPVGGRSPEEIRISLDDVAQEIQNGKRENEALRWFGAELELHPPATTQGDLDIVPARK